MLADVSPTLLVISGLPASGKTHLASQLAPWLGWPLVTKDDYKAILHRHLPDLSHTQAGPLSFELLYRVAAVVLAAGGSAVLETHFHRGVSEAKIHALAGEARLLQVFCEAPLDELRRRHTERVTSGARPHIDLPFDHAELPPSACWTPLELNGPLLRLDTTCPDPEETARAWVQANTMKSAPVPMT
ncbi:Predicted kinase [Deinococcus hopiensis KR-140]|uniref:Predicted kinase n=1 Tax=Deinococcus hopiensis KR-140 TaxID=695939 RepID=A0A1W1V574_9DEIO|nr:Predicted kinase [Deinococcus hopiensis KR-140]